MFSNGLVYDDTFLALAYNKKKMVLEAIREFEEGLRISPWDEKALKILKTLRGE